MKLAQRRCDELQRRNPEAARTTLVRWLVAVDSTLGYALRHGDLTARLLRQTDDPERWPNVVGVAVETSSVSAAAGRSEEDTILGEYLRAVETLKQHPKRIADPRGWLHDHPHADQLSALINFGSSAYRERLLRDLETLGLDLLQPPQADVA